MSTQIADLSVRMSASPKAMSAGLTSGTKSVKMFSTTVQTENVKMKRSWADTEKSLKSLNDNMEMLTGAGKMAGVMLAAQTFGAVGKGIRDATAAAANGAGGAEIAEGFVKALPIVSSVYEGLYNIGAAITGLDADLAVADTLKRQMEKDKAAVDALTDSTARLSENLASVRQEFADAAAVDAAAPGFNRDQVKARVDFARAQREADAELQKTLADLQAKQGGSTDVYAMKQLREATAAAKTLRDEKIAAARVTLDQQQNAASENDQRSFTSTLAALQQEQEILKQTMAGTPEALARFTIEVKAMSSATADQKRLAIETIAEQLKLTEAMREQVRAQEEAKRASERNARTVSDALASAQAQLDMIGKSPIELKLKAVMDAGATNDQLNRYRKILEEIETKTKAATQAENDKADAIRRAEEAGDTVAHNRTAANSADSRSAEAIGMREDWRAAGAADATFARRTSESEKVAAKVDRTNQVLESIDRRLASSPRPVEETIRI